MEEILTVAVTRVVDAEADADALALVNLDVDVDVNVDVDLGWEAPTRVLLIEQGRRVRSCRSTSS